MIGFRINKFSCNQSCLVLKYTANWIGEYYTIVSWYTKPLVVCKRQKETHIHSVDMKDNKNLKLINRIKSEIKKPFCTQKISHHSLDEFITRTKKLLVVKIHVLSELGRKISKYYILLKTAFGSSFLIS